MSQERAPTDQTGVIVRVLVQAAVAFGVGVGAALAALVASGYQPDIPFSGFLVLSPLWLLPIATLVVVNLRRVSRAKVPFNVALFLVVAFIGEVCVASAIASADHG